MLMPNAFSLIFLIAILLHLSLQWWLSQRHIGHVARHRNSVPGEFHGTVSLDDHQKAADYTVAKTKFTNVEHLLEAALLLAWTTGGGLQFVDTLWRQAGIGPLSAGVGFLLSVFLLKSVLEIPTTLYRTFVLEQRFGFNRTNTQTFFSDFVKESLLLVVIGAPLCYAILWLMINAGVYWWAFAWLTWISFSILMMWAYPTFIAPLFNKFTPLANGELRARIEALLHRNGFLSNGIFIMDGSARSAHGNAYFTGFGASKRIVFFDTLIADLNPDELESVLAHELGHFKCKHILKQLGLMSLLSFCAFALLGWLATQTWFYQGLGISTASAHAGLMLFLFVAPVLGAVLHPAMSWISRRYEFEADSFAARQADGKALVQALVKLYKENASTLTPDPIYSAYYDSHPSAPIRIAHLRSVMRA
jgi:STE24 endopeptidase